METLKDYALSHGAVIRSPASNNPNDSGGMHVPLTLFPSPFPKALFYQARSIQEAFQSLYMNVSNDSEFLGTIVKEMNGADEFTAKIWELYQIVQKEGIAQPLSLGIFRSDYLLDYKNGDISIKQVELNTISASFGGLSSKVSELHRLVINLFTHPPQFLLFYH